MHRLRRWLAALRSVGSCSDGRHWLFMTLLFISLLFPLVLITGLRIFAALILFALILLLFLGLCQPFIRVDTLRFLFFLLVSFLFLFGCFITFSFLIWFILLFLFNCRLLLFALFIVFVFVLGLGCIFDVLLDFNNGLDDVIGCYGRLLLLFLLISASQEGRHHIVAL